MAVKKLQEMARGKFFRYFPAILSAAYEISEKRSDFADNFTLIANRGPRQEVGQVHFHMFTDHKAVNDYRGGGERYDPLYHDEFIRVIRHPEPNREPHFLLVPGPSAGENGREQSLKSVLNGVGVLGEKFGLAKRGYSLEHRFDRAPEGPGLPIFHIAAGKKTRPAAE